MAAYDLPLQQIAGLTPTAPSGGLSGLANFVANTQKLESDRKLNEDRDALLAWEKGADGRKKVAAKDFNQSMFDANLMATGDAGSTYEMLPEVKEALYASPGFQALSLPEQEAHIAKKTEAFRNSPAKFMQPREFENLLRSHYADTSATPEQIESAITRTMASEYNTMDKDTGHLMIGQNQMPTMDGAGRLFGVGTGGGNSPATKPGTVSDSNLRDSQEAMDDLYKKFGAEGGEGSWWRDLLGIDVGKPDTTERGLAKVRQFAVDNGIPEYHMVKALETIRKNDTMDVKLEDMVFAGKEGKTPESRALIAVVNNAKNLMAQENANNFQTGNPGGMSTEASLAAQNNAANLFQSQMADYNRRQQMLVSGMKPRASTAKEREQFVLGDFYGWEEPKAPVAPPPTGSSTGGDGKLLGGSDSDGAAETGEGDETDLDKLLGVEDKPLTREEQIRSDRLFRAEDIPKRTPAALLSLSKDTLDTNRDRLKELSAKPSMSKTDADRDEMASLMDTIKKEKADVKEQEKGIENTGVEKLMDAGLNRHMAKANPKDMTDTHLQNVIRTLKNSDHKDASSLLKRYESELATRQY